MSVRLSTGRVVTSSATSTPAVGFYPRVTLFGDGGFLPDLYSIDAYTMPCVW